MARREPWDVLHVAPTSIPMTAWYASIDDSGTADELEALAVVGQIVIRYMPGDEPMHYLTVWSSDVNEVVAAHQYACENETLVTVLPDGQRPADYLVTAAIDALRQTADRRKR